MTFDPKTNYRLVDLATSYLKPKGWFLSLSGDPQDSNGAVPWVTYPAAAMLSKIVKPNFKVFEFGCGASTAWWSNKASEVVAVDHDQNWALRAKQIAPKATVIHREINSRVNPVYEPVLDEFFDAGYELPVAQNWYHNVAHGLLCQEFAGYASEILNYPTGYFDCVIIDGMARVLTTWLAIRQLGPNGILVFDNSERWQYNAAYQLLDDAGFTRLDFVGLGPVQSYEWCTSIFVRNLDVLKSNPLIPRGQQSDLGW